MAEGTRHGLEAGERVEIARRRSISRATRDMAHPRRTHPFIAAYRKAGGQVDLELLPGEAEGFIQQEPRAAARTIDRNHRVTCKSTRLAPSCNMGAPRCPPYPQMFGRPAEAGAPLCTASFSRASRGIP